MIDIIDGAGIVRILKAQNVRRPRWSDEAKLLTAFAFAFLLIGFVLGRIVG